MENGSKRTNQNSLHQFSFNQSYPHQRVRYGRYPPIQSASMSYSEGIRHNDEVDTSAISPFLQENLDGLEFAKCGSVPAAMGHPHPSDLRYAAVGNDDC